MRAACAMARGIPRSLRYSCTRWDEARDARIRGARAVRAATSSRCQRGRGGAERICRTASDRKEDGERGSTHDGGERISLPTLRRSSLLPRLPEIVWLMVSSSTIAWQQWQKPQPVLESIERER